MKINLENNQVGNKAIASVLLLYYHLLIENGFTNDQTVYLAPEDFNGFDYLDVEVNENQCSLGIDQTLLKEGAVIYLLSNLKDMVDEFENDFLTHPISKKIIDAMRDGQFSAIPESTTILSLITSKEQFDYQLFNEQLSTIYDVYVKGRFRKLLT